MLNSLFKDYIAILMSSGHKIKLTEFPCCKKLTV